MKEKTILEDIRQKNLDMTPGERKVAVVIMSEYPTAGLQTIADLSKRSGVSGQTVLRFVSKLEFNSYPAFQCQLIEELKIRQDSPLSLYGKRDMGQSGNELINSSNEFFIANLRETFGSILPEEVDRTIGILCDNRHEIILTGGRFSELLADYFYRHTYQLRSKTEFLPSNEKARTDRLIDISSKTVIFISDFRRYQANSIDFAKRASEKGAKIILVTDQYLSPISQIASIVLPIDVQSPSPFDSQVSGMALIELLVSGMLNKLGERAHKRIQIIEENRDKSNENI